MTEGAREQGRGIGGLSTRVASWLAWSMWALSLPFVAISGVLGFLSASARIDPDSGFIGLLGALLALTFPTVGALIASRRPENPIGWIFCAVGPVLGAAASASAYTEYALYPSSGPLPGMQYGAWISAWASFPTLLLVATMLFLLFPDGRLPSPQWRPVAWTAVIARVMAASVLSIVGSRRSCWYTPNSRVH